MADNLFGAKPLAEPMLYHCQLDPQEQNSVKLYSKFKHFHSSKCIWKCHVENVGHFVSLFYSISCHDINLVLSEYCSFSNRKVNIDIWYMCMKWSLITVVMISSDVASVTLIGLSHGGRFEAIIICYNRISDVLQITLSNIFVKIKHFNLYSGVTEVCC